MPWYGWDDDFYEPDDKQSNAATDTLVIAGPLYAVSKRGDIGATWWGKQWVAAMMAMGDTRLSRGKSYARNGSVRELRIQSGGASGPVQGSSRRPYDTGINLRVFTADEWDRALDTLSGQAIYSANLLAGEMPSDIESVFQSIGLSLFPSSRRDIGFDCTCPDWGDPCKHAAALYYLLAEQLDADPFVLFHLRGMPRERVLAELRRRRGGDQVAESTTAEQAPRIDADVERFWMGSAIQPLQTAPVIPAQPPLLIVMGEPPENTGKELRRIYQHVSQEAMDWLLREPDEPPPAGEPIAPEHLAPTASQGSKSTAAPVRPDLPKALSVADLALIRDREARFAAILVDCYDVHEELAAFHVYVEDALILPFEAVWDDPDSLDRGLPVTVIGVAGVSYKRGVLLSIKLGGKKRRVPAEQVRVLNSEDRNAIVLEDYRDWWEGFGGFDDFDEIW
jgi:uncharacterized Zn finger protein